MFHPQHAVRVRPPYEVKTFGHPDKPYVIEWSYPLMYNGKCIDTRRRHKLTTADKAFAFALKHRIPRDRLPYAIRKKLCEYAHTVKATTSTSTAPCDGSSAASASSGCRGSVRRGRYPSSQTTDKRSHARQKVVDFTLSAHYTDPELDKGARR